MKKLNLMDVLEGMEDMSRQRSVMYPLHEVLIIMLLAVICGATPYAKVEMSGIRKKEWLSTFLKLEYGIPDVCTFRNIIKEIDIEKLHILLAEKINRKDADYIFSLKENQKKLYNDVKLYLDDIVKDRDVIKSPNYHKTVEKGHGSLEIRKCVISEETEWLSSKPK